MIPLWWSIALAAIGILGIWLAGRKNLWGWAIGVLAQGLWITYACVTQQWGFIVSALAYAAVYGWNWRKWVNEAREGRRSQPAAAQPHYPPDNHVDRHRMLWTRDGWVRIPPTAGPGWRVVRMGDGWVAFWG